MKLETKKYILPKGFKSIGFHGKIKELNSDMAVLFSETPSVFAGVFTQNIVKAACVNRNKEILTKAKSVNAILVNSGNANACTGKKGEEDNEKLADNLALLLKIEKESVLTASTGVIGVNLPMDNILKAIPNAVPQLTSKSEGFQSAGRAILTTDLNEKYASVVIKLGDKDVLISGIAKGSGMIHPNMATMLGFILTDANISQNLLQKALAYAANKTFNMISVDGDTSTNDMVLVMANGKAENIAIKEDDDNFKLLVKALFNISKHLAKSIVRDGEGATKLIEVEVNGCTNLIDAQKIAKSVIGSSLVKTAIFGGDPNWGRIIAAIGYSGAEFDPEKVSIYFQGAPGYVCVMQNGEPHHFDAGSAEAILKQKDVFITINMDSGNYTSTAWGCDLSYDYVKINADYHT
ncbi:MAG: bifunctional glutamate N-acetyltransferase/amino-acid acetyltransferase ArgJ [Spirochaetia bacterium]|jgi:glutamate N-acetyltransferase/amino-acid N-acetyltransferase|nr:bifunctional glutamate N-acetyltransferase/amino-acid acetyltransferase ArgJ [Spirochaetia bacterium]